MALATMTKGPVLFPVLAIMTAPLILGWTADQIGLQGAFAIIIILFAVTGSVAVTANAIGRKEEELDADYAD